MIWTLKIKMFQLKVYTKNNKIRSEKRSNKERNKRKLRKCKNLIRLKRQMRQSKEMLDMI